MFFPVVEFIFLKRKLFHVFHEAIMEQNSFGCRQISTSLIPSLGWISNIENEMIVNCIRWMLRTGISYQLKKWVGRMSLWESLGKAIHNLRKLRNDIQASGIEMSKNRVSHYTQLSRDAFSDSSDYVKSF